MGDGGRRAYPRREAKGEGTGAGFLEVVIEAGIQDCPHPTGGPLAKAADLRLRGEGRMRGATACTLGTAAGEQSLQTRLCAYAHRRVCRLLLPDVLPGSAEAVLSGPVLRRNDRGDHRGYSGDYSSRGGDPGQHVVSLGEEHHPSLDQLLTQLRHAIPLSLPLFRLVLQQTLYAIERCRDCFEVLAIGHGPRLASRSADPNGKGRGRAVRLSTGGLRERLPPCSVARNRAPKLEAESSKRPAIHRGV